MTKKADDTKPGARKDRKGSVVQRVENPRTERKGTVRLDKSDMIFFARDPDVDETPETRGQIVYFESKDGDDVKRWVRDRLKKPLSTGTPLTWLPVIEVHVESERDHGNRRSRSETEERETSVSIKIDRFYLALTNDRTEWLKLEWHQLDPKSASMLEDADRLASAQPYAHGPKWVQVGGGSGRSGYRYYERSEVFALPFLDENDSVVAHSDDLWAGLTTVFDNIDRTVETIEHMLGTKKWLALLAEVGRGAKQLAAGTMATTDG